MKQLQLIIAFLALFSVTLQGQSTSKPSTGVIYGKVIGPESPQGLAYANVVVYQGDNTTATKVVTTSDGGRFLFKDLPFGKYHLEITFLGLEKHLSTPIELNEKNTKVLLETISLEVGSNDLQEIQITGEKVTEQMDLVTKRFNVSQNINNAGGSALDAMRNIPSLNVDLDGGVQLRGSNNVRILVNGRPSSLVGSGGELRLDQIPVASIEAIEVITNPSAKYEADGKVGVINIIMKRPSQLGFNYNVNFLTGSEDKWNAGIGMNYRTEKWNYRLGYQFNRKFMRSYKDLNRQSIYPDTTYFLLEESVVDKLKIGHTVNFGVDWNPTSKTEVFTGLTVNPHTGQKTSYFYYDLFDENNLYDSNSIRNTQDDEQMYGLQAEAGINQRFSRKGMSWNSVYSYDLGTKADSVLSEEDFLFNEDLLSTEFGKNRRDQIIITQLFKTDFTYPVTKETKLETGYSYSLRNLNNDFKLQNKVGNDWIFDAEKSNDLYYEEKIRGAYVMGSSTINRWDLNAGVRVEGTFVDVELAGGKDTYPNNYTHFFPSGHVGYEFIPKGKGQMMLSYSRRINRPSYRRLNPFVSYNDNKNIRRGNPLLRPELTDSWELGWQSQWKKGGLNPAIFYRFTKDKIGYFTHLLDDGVRELTFKNIKNSISQGVELNGNYNPVKWLRLSGNISYYKEEKDGTNLDNDNVNEGNIVLSRMMLTILPLKPMSIQLSGFYHSGFVGLVGNGDPMRNMDLGLTYKVFKNRGKLIVRLSDVFKTREFSFHVNTHDIKMDFARRSESRILWVGFNWELKQTKKKRSRRKGHSGKGMEF